MSRMSFENRLDVPTGKAALAAATGEHRSMPPPRQSEPDKAKTSSRDDRGGVAEPRVTVYPVSRTWYHGRFRVLLLS